MEPRATLCLEEIDMGRTHKSFAHSPSLWHSNSDALWASALVVQLAFENAWPEHLKHIEEKYSWSQAGGFDEDNPDTWNTHQRHVMEGVAEMKALSESHRVAAMLRAQSIEAELKAAYYRKAIAEAGHVDNVESRVDHHLDQIADVAGIPLSDEERDELKAIQVFLQLGRYPIAILGTRRARTFQVNFGTDPDRDARIREKVKHYSRLPT